ncbi:hypothetical protein F4778DRAFT_743382 [Xylariomycetidae sp. FL2044]|nr:hypothetical protein F4778DRAFT_743382 [Xylariomycetidae sp. FL2044]
MTIKGLASKQRKHQSFPLTAAGNIATGFYTSSTHTLGGTDRETSSKLNTDTYGSKLHTSTPMPAKARRATPHSQSLQNNQETMAGELSNGDNKRPTSRRHDDAKIKFEFISEDKPGLNQNSQSVHSTHSESSSIPTMEQRKRQASGNFETPAPKRTKVPSVPAVRLEHSRPYSHQPTLYIQEPPSTRLPSGKEERGPITTKNTTYATLPKSSTENCIFSAATRPNSLNEAKPTTDAGVGQNSVPRHVAQINNETSMSGSTPREQDTSALSIMSNYQQSQHAPIQNPEIGLNTRNETFKAIKKETEQEQEHQGIQSARKQTERAKGHISTLDARLKLAEARIQAARQEADSARQRTDSANRNHDTILGEIVELKGVIDEQKMRCRSMELELKAIKGRTAITESDIRALKDRNQLEISCNEAANRRNRDLEDQLRQALERGAKDSAPQTEPAVQGVSATGRAQPRNSVEDFKQFISFAAEEISMTKTMLLCKMKVTDEEIPAYNKMIKIWRSLARAAVDARNAASIQTNGDNEIAKLPADAPELVRWREQDLMGFMKDLSTRIIRIRRMLVLRQLREDQYESSVEALQRVWLLLDEALDVAISFDDHDKPAPIKTEEVKTLLEDMNKGIERMKQAMVPMMYQADRNSAAYEKMKKLWFALDKADDEGKTGAKSLEEK